MEELYEKKLNCPVCSNSFTTYKAKISKLKIEKIDTDFFTYYIGENPIKYGVFVCPKCGYSAMEKTFNNIDEKGKKIIREKVSSKWKEKDFSRKRNIDDAIKAYKLALYCGEILKLNRLQLASICLRLGWLYRMKRDNEEFRFLNLALRLYEEAFYKDSLLDSDMDEVTLGYLIGELYRRTGHADESVSWFNKVVSMNEIKDNPKIEKMAREQWRVAKEMMNN